MSNKPIAAKTLHRLLILMVVVLSLAAGYYQTQLQVEKKKYLRIEDMFVRVRDQLGRESTQQLIDQSYN